MNNYNSNKNGVSVDINIFQDGTLATMYFEESIERIRKNDNLFFYTDCGQISQDKIEIKIKGKKKELAEWYDVDEKDYTKEELIKEILSAYSIEEFLDNELEGIEYETNATIIETRGYSQGDYAKVIVLVDEVKKLWGKTPTNNELQNIIDQLFWDCPVSGTITIDNVETDIGEFVIDSYDWEQIKNDVIKWAKTQGEEVHKEIETMLENYEIEYQD